MSLCTWYRVVVYLVMVVAFYPRDLEAQEVSPFWRGGFYLGPLIPGSMPGVTEVVKGFGGTFGGRDPGGAGFEAGFFRAAEDGSIVNMATGSLVIEWPIRTVTDVRMITSVGIQTFYYRPEPNDSGVASPYQFSGGIHMGGGVTSDISDTLAFRWQFAIVNGPGRSVLVEFGLEKTFGL